MRFDTKIGIVVREDLAVWQKLNVTAFLASAVAVGAPEIMGEPYEDGAGNRHLAMFGQPVLVYAADAEALRRVHATVLRRGLDSAVFIEDMFKTGNDVDNRAAFGAADAGNLPLVGLAVHGPRNAVDKTLKGLALHG